MKVKALKKEFEVKDMSFAEKRKLQRRAAGGYFEGKPTSDEFYDVIDSILEFSGLKEKELEGMSMADVDLLLVTILNSYLGLSEKEKK